MKSFKSKIERIASGMEYYALSVPLKVTQALGTRGPVPVSAQVNDSEIFVASFYPVGGGRHYLRVRNKILKTVEIQAGDTVRVQFTVRDRTAEVSPPSDLVKALKTKNLTAAFKALPIGKRSYLLRRVAKAAKAETRVKRIQDAVKEAEAYSKKK